MNPLSYLGSPGRPSWSADSKRVALNLNRQAVIVERDSKTVLEQIGPTGANIGSPQFSPDGEKIAYDLYTKAPNGKNQWTIQISDKNGKDPSLLVEHGRTPRWSPDGQQLAYSSYTDDHQTKVSVVSSDGTSDRTVSALPHSSDFAWSPNGQSIAYEAIDESGYQLRTTNLTNGQEQVLSDGLGGQYWDKSPQWSPSGQTLVFERRHRQFPAGSLQAVDLTTGLEKELLQKHADIVDPVFSPDGKKLVFGSNHGGRGGLDLFEMNLADLSLRALTDLPGDEHSPAFSPDGQSIAFLNTDRRRDSAERHQLHFIDSN